MTNQPLASFLLPSRGRVERLKLSLASIAETCNDKNCYEVMIWADDDDVKTIEFLLTLKDNPTIKTTIGARGRGYLDLNVFCNHLASVSSGEFIWLFNDDAQIVTQGWDDVLKNHLADKPKVYQPSSKGHTRNIFPCVRRRIYEIMGRFSESALNDFYISTVAKKANIEQKINIEVFHDHPAQGGTIRDQTFLEAVAANVICKHDGSDPRIVACIKEDSDKIINELT